MMKRTLYILAGVLAFAACDSLKPEPIDIVQLGIPAEAIVVPETSGEDGVKVIADRDYSVEIVSGADWLTKGIAQNDTLSFYFEANSGFRRSAVIKVSAGSREDFLQVRQRGVFAETLSLSDASITVSAAGGAVQTRVNSNLPADYFTLFASDDKAIRKLRLEGNNLCFEVLPSSSRDARSFYVSVSFEDGWGEIMDASITIRQNAY